MNVLHCHTSFLTHVTNRSPFGVFWNKNLEKSKNYVNATSRWNSKMEIVVLVYIYKTNIVSMCPKKIQISHENKTDSFISISLFVRMSGEDNISSYLAILGLYTVYFKNKPIHLGPILFTVEFRWFEGSIVPGKPGR